MPDTTHDDRTTIEDNMDGADCLELPAGYDIAPHIVDVNVKDKKQRRWVTEKQQKGWVIRREANNGTPEMIAGKTLDFVLSPVVSNPFETRDQAEASLLSYVALMREYRKIERKAVVIRSIEIPFCPKINVPKNVKPTHSQVTLNLQDQEYHETIFKLCSALRESNAEVEGKPVANTATAMKWLLKTIASKFVN